MRMRGAAMVAVCALAIGIAATTTMFSVVDATLWRLPPLPGAQQLAILHLTVTTPRDGLQRQRWSMPEILALRKAVTSYESLASFTGASIAIHTASPQSSAVSPQLPEQIDGEIVAPD